MDICGCSCFTWLITACRSGTEVAVRLFLPSGQKSRRRSGSPTLLKGGEVVLTSVTKAKTLELFALNGFGFPSEGTPASTIQPSDVVRQLLLMASILLPPGGIGD